MIKLDIQLFGGRGASSSNKASKGNSISVEEQGRRVRISFYDINKGDTFEVVNSKGQTITLTVGSYMGNDRGYYAEGRTKEGTGITTLVTDDMYNKASKVSKLYMVPLSKTKNWKRK